MSGSSSQSSLPLLCRSPLPLLSGPARLLPPPPPFLFPINKPLTSQHEETYSDSDVDNEETDSDYDDQETHSDYDDQETDSDAQSYHSRKTVKSDGVSPPSDEDYEDEYKPETDGDWDLKNDIAYVGDTEVTIEQKVSMKFLAVSIHGQKKWVEREEITDEVINKYYENKYRMQKLIEHKVMKVKEKVLRPKIHNQLHLTDVQLEILKAYVQAKTKEMMKLID